MLVRFVASLLALTAVIGLPFGIPDQAGTATALAQPGNAQAPVSFAYHFPVQPASVTSYGPYHHDYPATDIFCPVGSRFVAPIGGIVDYVTTVDRWDPKVDGPATRGGLSVAIIGDDGVRYYGAHLSAIAAGIEVGSVVEAGQLLGLTGKTGDARFVSPHLHFGISHPTTPDDWAARRGEVSPYKYLQAWQAGKSLAPQVPGVVPQRRPYCVPTVHMA